MVGVFFIPSNKTKLECGIYAPRSPQARKKAGRDKRLVSNEALVADGDIRHTQKRADKKKGRQVTY
jgi:hypothetical protein